MKTIRVAAAVICRGNKVFAVQRGYGEYKDFWEFPGGKIEPGERAEEALVREILEEHATEIRVLNSLGTIEYDYPSFHLSMECFLSEVVSGTLDLLEAEDARWLRADELESVNWLPADRVILDEVRTILEESR
ncbi:MAG: (deoxy)nucleoside triphosphate pyrophosphohydrolase [Solobacterium sp.]|nr:(deoxy)nucleoside triphosphate pyrophosphohydrolase [Solobacterium sp.]